MRGVHRGGDSVRVVAIRMFWAGNSLVARRFDREEMCCQLWRLTEGRRRQQPLRQFTWLSDGGGGVTYLQCIGSREQWLPADLPTCDWAVDEPDVIHRYKYAS